jgi:membrane protease subunit HflK
MYLDAMQQIYSNVTKVMVDSSKGSNLLYLPLDKLMHMTGASNGPESAGGAQPNAPATPQASVLPNDARSRDSSRTRDRESR